MNRSEFARKKIEQQIYYAEDAIKDAREGIRFAVDHGSSADGITAWCNNLKRAEQQLREAKELKKLIVFLEDDEQ